MNFKNRASQLNKSNQRIPASDYMSQSSLTYQPPQVDNDPQPTVDNSFHTDQLPVHMSPTVAPPVGLVEEPTHMSEQTDVEEPTSSLPYKEAPNGSKYLTKNAYTTQKDLGFETVIISDDTMRVDKRIVTFPGKIGRRVTHVEDYYDECDVLVYKTVKTLKYIPPQSRIVRVGTLPLVSRNNYFDPKYETLSEYATPILPSNEPLVGYEDLMESIRMYVNKDGMSNALLLAEPGQGKTATMQVYATTFKDTVKVFTISMAAMNSHGQLSQNLEKLFEDLEQFKLDGNTDHDIIIFIDEFHQWPMYSPASIESLKPQMARSAQLGIHIIGATTYDEYRQYIRDNAAFSDRFPPRNLPLLNDDQVYEILKNKIAKNKLVDSSLPATQAMLRKIVHYTNLHMQNRAQPRKSLDVLDMALSYVKIGTYKFDDHVLERVFFDTVNVKLTFSFDAVNLHKTLSSMVYDQQFAVDQVARRCYSIMLDVVDENKPLGAYLFQGSTGVGKTELAKALGKTLFGKDAKIAMYDMGEFAPSDAEAPRRFQTTLTDDMIEAHPVILLFDEIEKAHPEIAKMFYALLDEGRLSDKNGRKTSFSKVICIFTTNVGENVSADFANRGLTAEESAVQIKKSLRTIRQALETSSSFPQALLGRINAIVPFVPLTHSTNEKIADRRLDEMSRRFLKNIGVTVSLNKPELINYVTLEKYDRDPGAGGARQIKNRVDSDITDAISEYVLFHPDDHYLRVDVAGETLRDNLINESKAYITVTAIDPSDMTSEKEDNTVDVDDDLILSTVESAVQQDVDLDEMEINAINTAIEMVSMERSVFIQPFNLDNLVEVAKAKSDTRPTNTNYAVELSDFMVNWLNQYFETITYEPYQTYTIGTKDGNFKVVANRQLTM